jgi:hypothetical protein
MMQGKVSDFDAETGVGIIESDDGDFVFFNTETWRRSIPIYSPSGCASCFNRTTASSAHTRLACIYLSRGAFRWLPVCASQRESMLCSP